MKILYLVLSLQPLCKVHLLLTKNSAIIPAILCALESKVNHFGHGNYIDYIGNNSNNCFDLGLRSTQT